MILVESIRQLETYIDQANELQKTNNFYLYEDDISRLITQRRLFYDIIGNSLYLYSDEDTHFQLYFFVDGLKQICACNTMKPLVCEVLLRDGDDGDSRKMHKLTQVLRVNKTSRMYTFRLKCNERILRQQYDITEGKLADKQFSIRNASEEDMPVLQRLWSYLDPLDFKYISPEELRIALAKKEITVAESSLTGVCATIWTIPKGNTSMHKHFAVDENMRGNGIGRSLLFESLMQSFDKGTVVQSCWLDIHNASTLHLHNAVGFVPSNKLSVQFII